MYWPVRMCHPVSPSPSSDIQPLAPQTNNQRINAIKKKSENDGVSRRAIPRHALRSISPGEAIGSPGPRCVCGGISGGGCVEVANGSCLGHPCPSKLIDFAPNLL